ncbi:MAG: substrate-binding domain-containing protein [Clostridiales Family XIII bacterium]|jgi:DNA-binding transcriptional LysR family regulator|nr:substrate-binding domain-containing protein [Clostridiales Family XIII bacterium]
MLETFMASFDNFYNEALELGQNRKTTLTVGMPAILGSFFFERLIPKFEEANPGIHLTIHETPTLIGLKMIKENLLDLFIGIIEKEDPSYDCKLIFETNLVFWASREHPLASEKVIKGSDLRNQPFIMVPQGSYHFKVISRQYENIPLNVVMHSNQLPTIRYMLKNLAVTILYEQVFENDDAFCKIPLSEPLPAKIGVFWKKNTYLTDAMRAFVRFIKSIQL